MKKQIKMEILFKGIETKQDAKNFLIFCKKNLPNFHPELPLLSYGETPIKKASEDDNGYIGCGNPFDDRFFEIDQIGLCYLELFNNL